MLPCFPSCLRENRQNYAATSPFSFLFVSVCSRLRMDLLDTLPSSPAKGINKAQRLYNRTRLGGFFLLIIVLYELVVSLYGGWQCSQFAKHVNPCHLKLDMLLGRQFILLFLVLQRCEDRAGLRQHVGLFPHVVFWRDTNSFALAQCYVSINYCGHVPLQILIQILLHPKHINMFTHPCTLLSFCLTFPLFIFGPPPFLATPLYSCFLM